MKSLGVLLDDNLSLETQVTQVVKVYGNQLRNIVYVRKYLNEVTMKMLFHYYAIRRLASHSSLYYGLPDYRLRKLQNILNTVARLNKSLPSRESKTPALIDLHWLPIKVRIV